MKLWVGASGYSYKEWKGSFYPQDIPEKDMLAVYARKYKKLLFCCAGLTSIHGTALTSRYRGE